MSIKRLFAGLVSVPVTIGGLTVCAMADREYLSVGHWAPLVIVVAFLAAMMGMSCGLYAWKGKWFEDS